MNFPFYIARRYLLAKKSHNAINIISFISVMGVMTGTMALVVILSVFNGFDHLVRSLINSFNPDLKIEVAEGKTFTADSAILSEIRNIPGVFDLSKVIEDKALVRYDEQQTIAEVKGVDEHFEGITGIDSMMVEGEFTLDRRGEPLAVIGRGIKIYLNVMMLSPRQMSFNVPKRSSSVFTDPLNALNRRYLSASGVFSIEQDYDLRYIIVPLSFARDLFEYDKDEITHIEVKLKPGAGSSRIQSAIAGIMGKNYRVLNRYEQNEVFYKTMKAEKWAIFLILFFILVIASFNVIGTLTMLMLEKKKDATTLSHLGADKQLIKKIFLTEGFMVSAIGAILGCLLGLLICWIQIRFGVIRLQGMGSFIIDAYPVVVKAGDIVITFIAVTIIGYLAAWYPIRYFTRREMERGSE